MTVSVIIPMYNAGRYIERCFVSLQKQTFSDFELIFVDDASTDDTLCILRALLASDISIKNKSKVISLPHNGGSSNARRKGMNEAQGDYIIQVDSDDYVDPEYLAFLMRKAEDTNADVVVCDFYYAGATIRQKHLRLPEDHDSCLSAITRGTIHNGLWNKLIKRSVLVENDILPLPDISMFDDKSMMFKVFYYARNIRYVEAPLYYYNVVNNESVSKREKASLIPSAIAVSDEIKRFFAANSHSAQVDRAIADFNEGMAALILLYGSKDDCRRYLRDMRLPTISHVMRHPVLPWHYRMSVLLYKVHLYPLVRVMRLIMSLMR